MKIAIIGTGIAGNVAAYHLAREHDITVFEAGSHVGGHTHTHDVEQDGRRFAVDTGFIVFNDRTYPNFCRLLDELGVVWQDSDMSFSVRDDGNDLEYNGTSLNALFCQRRNLVRPTFWRMLRDIVRFNREAPALLDDGDDLTGLGDYLAAQRYSPQFINHYIVPMGAAIWSTDPALMSGFPAGFFVRFLRNHGLLSVNRRPQWRVIRGGSARYVEKLTAPFRDRIRLNTPVERVTRLPGRVLVQARGADAQNFDAVFFACHSDQALVMLTDPTRDERDILGAIRYQSNEAVLHTDARLLPRRPLAWAAWNYQVLPAPQRVALTYNMNILQGLTTREPFLVTLNQSDAIDPARIIRRMTYDHPLFTPAAVSAQGRWHEIAGVRNTWYCGAYWRFGFHEDGVVSALAALRHFRESINHAQRPLSRTG